VELIPLPDQKPLEIKPAPAIKSQTKKPKSKKRKQKKEKQAKSTPVHPDQKILTSTPGQQVPVRSMARTHTRLLLLTTLLQLRTPSGTKPVSHQAVVAALVSTRRYNTSSYIALIFLCINTHYAYRLCYRAHACRICERRPKTRTASRTRCPLDYDRNGGPRFSGCPYFSS
jgi:hypothetical protein